MIQWTSFYIWKISFCIYGKFRSSSNLVIVVGAALRLQSVIAFRLNRLYPRTANSSGWLDATRQRQHCPVASALPALSQSLLGKHFSRGDTEIVSPPRWKEGRVWLAGTTSFFFLFSFSFWKLCVSRWTLTNSPRLV